jgi:hypothetical protein
VERRRSSDSIPTAFRERRVGGEFAGARYGVTSTKLHSCLEDNPDKMISDELQGTRSHLTTRFK